MVIIVSVVSFLLGVIVTDYLVSNDIEHKKLRENYEKIVLYYHRFNMWMNIKNEGYNVANYLRHKGYNRIAIYGMKELGERLYEEIRKSEINIVCIIDRNKNILGDFPIIAPDEEIPEVDLIIVTPEYYYYEIEAHLKKKTNSPIMSLSGVLGCLSGRNIA